MILIIDLNIKLNIFCLYKGDEGVEICCNQILFLIDYLSCFCIFAKPISVKVINLGIVAI